MTDTRDTWQKKRDADKRRRKKKRKMKPKFKVGQLLVNKYGYSDNVALVVKHAVTQRGFVDYDVVFKGEVHNWPEAYLTSQFKVTPQPDIETISRGPLGRQ